MTIKSKACTGHKNNYKGSIKDYVPRAGNKQYRIATCESLLA